MAILSKNRATTLGKFIALVLRHQPYVIGATLDENGWLDTTALYHNTVQPISIAELHEVVRTDDKGRYAFNEDGSKLRAVQGHSVKVQAGERLLSAEETPDRLYHGTARKNMAAIEREGLVPQTRQFVHLSANEETARAVGLRHSKGQDQLVILSIAAKELVSDGKELYIAENGVYLAKEVPERYVREA